VGKITEKRAEQLLRWLRPRACIIRDAEALIRSCDWRTLDAIRHMVQYIRRRFPKADIVLYTDKSAFDEPQCVIQIFTSPRLYDMEKVWDAVFDHFYDRYGHTNAFSSLRVTVDEVAETWRQCGRGKTRGGHYVNQ
jgi:NAD(P)-dependent dehydrogenase (short-subunit alcohol dehydrogenase family)